jgi:hypothetical protein
MLTALSVSMGRGWYDSETGVMADNDNHVILYFFFGSSYLSNNPLFTIYTIIHHNDDH